MEDLSPEDRQRAAVYLEVKRICTEIGTQINANFDINAIRLIAELTWKRLQIWGQDLEHFSKHAQRSTVNAEDVKLLVRRHPSLAARITKMVEENKMTAKENKKRNSKDAEREQYQPAAGDPGPSHYMDGPDIMTIDDD